jgi:hypothetical protein
MAHFERIFVFSPAFLGDLPPTKNMVNKYGNIVLTTPTGRRVRYHLCLLLLVRQAGYIVNLVDFYSDRLIGKLTAFLQIQEFSHRKLPVTSSTSAARLSRLD